MVERATNEEPQVASLVDETAHEAHAGRAVVRRKGVEERAGLLPFRDAEQLVDILDLHRPVGEGRDHVEDALRVAERALRVPRDRLERGGLALELLLLADRGELFDHPRVRDAAEVEALRARDDRAWDLPRLGRREHEDRVGRRLLERLQERVERLARQLMRLVDDVHLVLTQRRRETHLLPQVAHLVDAAVRRRIDLDEVEETALADGDAALAFVTGLAVLRLRAVDGLRDESRDRRLADAARPREQVCVRDLSRGDGVAERPRDVFLANDRGECLGAVAAIQG